MWRTKRMWNATHPDFASQNGLQVRLVRCEVHSELCFSQGSVKGADFNWSGALYLGAVSACFTRSAGWLVV